MRPEAKELEGGQAELRQLYLNLWPKLSKALADIPKERKVSKPFLLNITAHNYAQARKRLLIVAQQTNGWGDKLDGKDANSVDRLLKEYADFRLAAKYRSTPIAQATHELYRLLNGSEPADGFLWNNLFKAEEDNAPPKDDLRELLHSKFNVLPKEIELAAPDVVVFFTGPSKDEVIDSMFPGISFEPVDSQESKRALARIVDSHNRLPQPHTYRTYHPMYLRQRRKWHILAIIANMVGDH